MSPKPTPDRTRQLLDDAHYLGNELLGKLFTAPDKLHEADPIELQDLASHDHQIYLEVLRFLDQRRGSLSNDDLDAITEAIATRLNTGQATIGGVIRNLRADCYTAANIFDCTLLVKRNALDRQIADAVKARDAEKVADLVKTRDELRDRYHQSPRRNPYLPPPFTPFTEEEMAGARLHPTCFVENYLYADVGQICAAGGTGKSTVFIYEAICLAIGRDLWGHRVLNPGRTLFVTAEDSGEIFAARQREIFEAMDLNGHERRLTRESIAVWDVSGNSTRLAELDANSNIQFTPLADNIIKVYQGAGLAQIIFDPQVSFSPGERVINDGEQALITAARRIRNALKCAVRYIHHTGKANARNGATDQYAGRGGSTMPDGCRMVTILSSINGDHPAENPPTGFDLAPGETGFTLTQAKLSYAPPQPTVWIRRHGFTYEHFTDERRSTEQILDDDAEKIARFLAEELAHGRKHTRNTLEEIGALKLGRKRLRGALANLQASGRVVDKDLPREEQQGGRKSYLYLLRHLAEPRQTSLAK